MVTADSISLGCAVENLRVAAGYFGFDHRTDYREGRKNSKLVRSAPTLGLLATGADAPVERVKAGGSASRIAARP
jgi:hypothetical protein